MQTGKNTTTSVKDSVQNVAASAKSGLDKTKAVVQEKVRMIYSEKLRNSPNTAKSSKASSKFSSFKNGIEQWCKKSYVQ